MNVARLEVISHWPLIVCLLVIVLRHYLDNRDGEVDHLYVIPRYDV